MNKKNFYAAPRMLTRILIIFLHSKLLFKNWRLNPIWHGGGEGYFYPPCLCWIRYCQLFLFQKFSKRLEVKIYINRVILTPCPVQ